MRSARAKKIAIFSVPLLLLALGSTFIGQKTPDEPPVKDYPHMETRRPQPEPAVPPQRTLSSTEKPTDETFIEARKLVRSGNWAAAESIFLDLLKRDPSNKDVLSELLTIHYIDRKNYAEAMAYSERILRLGTSNPAEFDRYRELAGLANATDEALEFLASLDAPHPKTAYMIPLTSGRILDQRKRYDDAILAFRHALREDSEQQGLILELLASSAIRAMDYKQAQIALEESIQAYNAYNEVHAEKNPKDRQSLTNANFLLVNVYVNNLEYQKALDLIAQLLMTDSQNEMLLRYKKTAIEGLTQNPS